MSVKITKINKAFPVYKDGVAMIYRPKELRTSFGAQKSVSTLNDMDFIVKLFYEECSKREQDISFAESVGASLSLKIKTPYNKSVDSSLKAVINGFLYNIVKVDASGHSELYLYLEEEKKLDS